MSLSCLLWRSQVPSGGHPWLVTSLLEVAGPSGFIGGSEKACARLREEGAESRELCG